MRRFLSILAAVFVLAACSPGREAERAGLPGSRPGGRIAVAIPRPASIEPTNVYDAGGRLVAYTMCDQLMQLDPATGEAVPGVAESWQLSDRGSKISVKLRKGARFTDGSKVTADDVVFTLSLVASLEYASFTSDLLSPIAGYALVHGDEETTDAERRRRLSGVKITGSGTFEVKLSQENADFFRVLAHPLASPISRRGSA